MHARVLVATDLSEASAAAARFSRLVAHPGAVFRYLHVTMPPDVPLPREVAAADDVRHELEDVLAAWVRRLDGEAEVKVLEGRPADVIAHEAAAWGADLVVMGARGASRVERLLLGSTARATLRRVSCDVLVSRREGTSVQRIVLATDFHAPSRAAGRVARDLARAHGARIVAVHVVDPFVWASIRSGPAARREADRAWVEKSLGEMLHGFVRDEAGGEADEVLATGRVASEIARQAEMRRADLVIVGTHGGGPFERAILGSVAEGVVEAAAGPVLVARPHA